MAGVTMPIYLVNELRAINSDLIFLFLKCHHVFPYFILCILVNEFKQNHKSIRPVLLYTCIHKKSSMNY